MAEQHHRMAEINELVGASWQYGSGSRTIDCGKMPPLLRTGHIVSERHFLSYRFGTWISALGAAVVEET